jgi:hypothetical protein
MKTTFFALLLLSFSASAATYSGQGRIQINGGNIFPCERVELATEQSPERFDLLRLEVICQRQEVIKGSPIAFEIRGTDELWKDGSKVGYLALGGFGFHVQPDATRSSRIALLGSGEFTVQLTRKVPGQPIQTATLNAWVTPLHQ